MIAEVLYGSEKEQLYKVDVNKDESNTEEDFLEKNSKLGLLRRLHRFATWESMTQISRRRAHGSVNNLARAQLEFIHG